MAASGLYRVYIGNLAENVQEETLERLFQEHDLSPFNILVKRGYAFVDLPDHSSFDRAIETLNEYNLMGSVMQVEPSSVSKRKRTNRIQIRGVPSHASKDDIEQLVATFGQVQKCDLASGGAEPVVNVTYENPDQAQQAVDSLDNYDYQGSLLKVEFAQVRESNGNGQSGRNGRSRPRNSGTSRGSGYPLRILVPSDFVGAIIGKKGATIRRITTECKARVDVQGKGNSGLLEKVISIYGQPENCSNACKQIMEVMQAEAASTNRQEVPLKMLADDRFCGRIIGKEGKIIKKLREDTESKISVSNVQEMPALYPDRVITIRGAPENVSQAEAQISAKLREAYDKEMSMPMPPSLMMQPQLGGPMMGRGGGMYGAMQSPYPYMGAGMYGGAGDDYGRHGGDYGRGGGGAQGGPMGHPQQQPPRDDVMIMVPNSAVGALIGAGGSHIKQIIRDSNAYVTIEPKKDDDPNPAVERVVTIKGSNEAKWKASYMVFDKLQKEGFAGSDDVRLRTAMKVPRSVVGRVIGKKGNNVRELQRMTGAMVKVPEDPQQQGDEVLIEIFGNFMQTNLAQNRLRAFIAQGQQMNGGGGGGAQGGAHMMGGAGGGGGGAPGGGGAAPPPPGGAMGGGGAVGSLMGGPPGQQRPGGPPPQRMQRPQ